MFERRLFDAAIRIVVLLVDHVHNRPYGEVHIVVCSLEAFLPEEGLARFLSHHRGNLLDEKVAVYQSATNAPDLGTSGSQ
jgi:hypothetical protein